jgi:cellulose synthase operon protein YhjQ
MVDRKTLVDQNEIPEDVATLYSWANLHGVKYRDFSASRAQLRDSSSLRFKMAKEEALEAKRQQERGEEIVKSTAEDVPPSPLSVAVEQATRVEQAVEPVHAPSVAPVAPPVSQPAPPEVFSAQTCSSATPAASPAAARPKFPVDAVVNEVSPAWSADLYTGRASEPVSPVQPVPSFRPVPHFHPAPPFQGEQQGTRDRSASRWYALHGVFEDATAPSDAVAAPVTLRAPVVAFFSLAGGVGKSSLTATLGRALSASGERVLLVDTAAFGVLPFFYGACDRRPGVLRTFNAPGAGKSAPVRMIAIDPVSMGQESFGSGSSNQDELVQEIARHAQGVSRILVDLATASAETVRRIMPLSPAVLVPVIPDMNSMVSVSSIDAFFQRSDDGVLPYYILNQFDPSLPLHLDLQRVLREQLGDRLLPFELRRSPVVSEALAEGITVIDYAPNSTVAEDFVSLAGWVKSLAATVGDRYRGLRWSER